MLFAHGFGCDQHMWRFVAPHGVEHQPFAEEETHLLLIEPSGTPNTGDHATAAPRRAI